VLARHRFFTPADIDGGGLSQGTSEAQLLQSTLQNTLEQAVLALSVHPIWAAAMPRTWQAAVPAAATLFVFGRLLFSAMRATCFTLGSGQTPEAHSEDDRLQRHHS
jgi:hypothetical protein